jgi:hypothetical protein
MRPDIKAWHDFYHVQGPSAKEINRDSTSFERANDAWSRIAVPTKGKVGASGDTKSTQWLGWREKGHKLPYLMWGMYFHCLRTFFIFGGIVGLGYC